MVEESPVAGAHVYVAPPLPDSVVELPMHTFVEDAAADISGREFTVMVCDDDAVQPLASVPVTVYALVFGGVTVISEPVNDPRPEAGVQLYETAPDTDRVVAPPVQILLLPGVIIMAGRLFIVIDRLAVAVHPAALVPVTVYTVVTVGVTDMGVPVVVDNPAAGIHE